MTKQAILDRIQYLESLSSEDCCNEDLLSVEEEISDLYSML